MFIKSDAPTWTGKILYSDCYVNGVSSEKPFQNKWAELPILGSLAGLMRIVLAILHIVGNILATFACCNKKHLAHVVKGFAELLRGVIELIPLVGNLFSCWMNGSCCFKPEGNYGHFFLVHIHNSPKTTNPVLHYQVEQGHTTYQKINAQTVTLWERPHNKYEEL